MTDPGSQGGDARLKQFDAAESAEKDRPTADRQADSAAIDCVCPDEVKKTHFYLGAHFQVAQYQIGIRDLLLRIQKLPVPSRDKEPFYALAAPALPVAQSHWNLEEVPQHAHSISPPPDTMGYQFNSILTHAAQGLKSEKTVPGYTLEAMSEPRLNELLGYSYAFHVLRSLTIPHRGTGNFERDSVGPPSRDLQPTEMLGIQLLFFFKAKVDGQVVIRKVSQGKVLGTVSVAEYTREKLAEVIRHVGPSYTIATEYGSLPMVPGVYTVTVLVEDQETTSHGAGAFRLVEVYCDGDCLYGPDDA